MYKDEIIEKFGSDYKDAGDEIRYCCPFCNQKRGKSDNDYKLYASIELGLFYCFKCGARGFVGKPKKTDTNNDIYNKILRMSGIESSTKDDEETNTFYIPDTRLVKGTVAYDYCLQRNITEEKIEYYDLRLGIDENYGRIIIPNQVYGSRGIWCDTYSARTYTNQIPKYKNPVGVKKSQIVFNLHRIKKGADDIYGVEGAITAICAGKEAIAFYGCCPSKTQIQMVSKLKPKNFYCVLDNDQAGRPNNIKLAEEMSKLIDGKIYLVYLPEGIDASDIGEERFKEYCDKNKIMYVTGAYKSILNYINK